MQEITSVAVIGIGTMGEQAVRHLRSAGFTVYARDPDPDREELAADLGAEIVASPQEAADHSDLSLVLVGTESQVNSVVLDPETGLVNSSNHDHIIGISSTISPEQCIELAETAASRGFDVLDVPTCRGEKAAAEADLLVMGGGEPDVFEVARPVLECLAHPENVVRLGEIGAGQVGKAANNTLLWTSTVANFEVLTLADAYGLDLKELRQLLVRSTADNWPLREWDWMHTKWAHKDMAITMAMAAERDESLPLTAVASQLVRRISENEIETVR